MSATRLLFGFGSRRANCPLLILDKAHTAHQGHFAKWAGSCSSNLERAIEWGIFKLALLRFLFFIFFCFLFIFFFGVASLLCLEMDLRNDMGMSTHAVQRSVQEFEYSACDVLANYDL